MIGRVLALAVGLVVAAVLQSPAHAASESIGGWASQTGGSWTNYATERTGTTYDSIRNAPWNLIDQTPVYSTLSLRLLHGNGAVWSGTSRSWVNANNQQTHATGTWAFTFRMSACCWAGSGENRWDSTLSY
jgi:hypothetical protein